MKTTMNMKSLFIASLLCGFSMGTQAQTQYSIRCSGLADGVTGGVTYRSTNYRGSVTDDALDREALLPMHVSGYNGSIESVDDATLTINVAYNQRYTSTSVLWNGNGDVANTKVPAGRIPAMVKASNGDILAFSDWRYSRDDVGRNMFHLGYQVDIEMRRSKDGGQTWSPAIIAADGDGSDVRQTAGYGDASVMADAESGRVLLMCVNAENTNRFTRFVSEDFGETWSAPTNIAADIAPLAPGCVFFTSGKMVQSRDFKKRGASYRRIYAPLCGGTADYVLYSDDFGMTWNRLGKTAAQTGTNNECRLVELPNGDILVDSRAGSVRKINVFTFTNREDATGSWGEMDQDGSMPTVDCNGDIDLVEGYAAGADQPTHILLQSLPRGGNNGGSRAHVQFYYKVLTDGHYTLDDLKGGWTPGLEVCAGKSAYSSIIHLEDGSEAILYEKAHAEEETGYNGNPWGYDITFSTHTLDAITNGEYFTEKQADK